MSPTPFQAVRARGALVPGKLLPGAPVVRKGGAGAGLKVAVLALWRNPFLHPDVALAQHGQALLEAGPDTADGLVEVLVVHPQDVLGPWTPCA